MLNVNCSSRSRSSGRKKSISSNNKTSSGNISSINNQSASLIGLDDPLSLYLHQRRPIEYQVEMETQDEDEAKGAEYGNINDNSSSATVLKQFKSYS